MSLFEMTFNGGLKYGRVQVLFHVTPVSII